jgi:Flp pilus assembly protein TadG
LRPGQRRLPPALARHLPGRGRLGHRDRGSATAELAVGLPALVLLLLVGLTAVSAVTTKLQCVDAAREAARTAARGESGSVAGTAPDGADVQVTVVGDTVAVTVRAPVRPLGPRLPSLSVQATAVAAVEPGAPEPAP